MGNFSRDNRGGDRGSFGRRPSFRKRPDYGNRAPRDREMFKAVCDNCGKTCEVPFRPTNGKPVYCSDCFEKNGERPQREFRTPVQRENNKADFDALNAKLDKILSLLEAK